MQTFIGDYSLSFLRRGKVWHVPIKSRQHDNGAIRFYLVDQGGCDTIQRNISSTEKRCDFSFICLVCLIIFT